MYLLRFGGYCVQKSIIGDINAFLQLSVLADGVI